MSNLSPRVLGLMSGTSADGVDCVLLELNGFPPIGSGGNPPELSGAVPRAKILGQTYQSYPRELRDSVLAAARDELKTSEIAQLDFELGEFLGNAALELSGEAQLIASHGQTVYHIPRVDGGKGWHTRATLQLGQAACIAEITARDVISDFRPADLAAGGQAAPLVPFADRILFARDGVKRAIHNLGGISNLTYLPGLEQSGVLAFDTGPANCLIDEAAALLGRRFDDGGRLASSGRVDPLLLERWKRNPYLTLEPPKSTGRELWNLQNLEGALKLEPRDIAATVTAFTAHTVVQAYQNFVLPLGLDEIFVAGGGTQNPVLMNLIRDGLEPISVQPLESLGMPSSAREAAAFAVLGYYARQGWHNTLPHTTGASRAVVAGKWTRAG